MSYAKAFLHPHAFRYDGTEEWTDDFGNKLVGVHPHSQCQGRPCAIHNPSDHHMRGMKLLWRQDWQMLERICEHGVGHPDPDDAAYWRSVSQPLKTVHGCDGCCECPN